MSSKQIVAEAEETFIADKLENDDNSHYYKANVKSGMLSAASIPKVPKLHIEKLNQHSEIRVETTIENDDGSPVSQDDKLDVSLP